MNYALLVAITSLSFIAYRYWSLLSFVNFMPGLRPLVSPLSPFGMILPNNSLNPGATWYWPMRHSSYFNKTHDIISVIPFLGSASYYTSSLDVMKQVLGAEMKVNTEKPYDMTLERLFGKSLPSANGDTWRRHRRVVQPSFSNKLYQSIGIEVARVYNSIEEAEGWKDRQEVDIPELNEFMLNFTLCIISKCGFGLDIAWPTTRSTSKSGPSDTALRGLTFADALRTVSKTLIPRIILPQWAYGIPFQRVRKMGESWDKLSTFMMSAIGERKDRVVTSAQSGEDSSDNLEDSGDMVNGDLLTCLVESWANIGKYGLSEDEVVGNMYSLMFAGHETTSSALVSVLAYLAIHQDIQERVFNEIASAVPSDGNTEDIVISRLVLTKFCVWEALRLYPSANFLPRQTTQDLQIVVNHPASETVLLKKGSWIMLDLISIFRNPHFFADPNTFHPERWEGVSEHDVGTFGFGPRACIGRKFAQTESIHLLAALLIRWRVEIFVNPGEERDAYAQRVLDNAGQTGTAFGLKHVPVKLIRRSQVD